MKNKIEIIVEKTRKDYSLSVARLAINVKAFSEKMDSFTI